MRTVLFTSRTALIALVLSWPACAQAPQPPSDGSARVDAPTPLVGDPATGVSRWVWSVFEDSHGNHWFGSRGEGVTRWDGKSFVRFTTKHGLGDDDVRVIQDDEAGNLYFGSGTSITRFDGRTLRSLKIPESTSPASEWKLVPTDLWFAGTQDTGVVFRTDGETVHRLAFPPTAAGDAAIAKYPRAQFPNAKYSPYDVYTIHRDRGGNVWFGTASLGACRFDGASFTWISEDDLEYETMLTGDQSFGVRGIVEDANGKFWFSNLRNRFAVVAHEADDPAQGPIRFAKEPGAGDPSTLLEQGAALFMSAVEDEHGHLWTATYGAGVWRFDGNEVKHYPITEGTTTVSLLSITADRAGVLWLGTHERGAYRFNGTKFEPLSMK